jgi:hypothetical protein
MASATTDAAPRGRAGVTGPQLGRGDHRRRVRSTDRGTNGFEPRKRSWYPPTLAWPNEAPCFFLPYRRLSKESTSMNVTTPAPGSNGVRPPSWTRNSRVDERGARTDLLSTADFAGVHAAVVTAAPVPGRRHPAPATPPRHAVTKWGANLRRPGHRRRLRPWHPNGTNVAALRAFHRWRGAGSNGQPGGGKRRVRHSPQGSA